jgi:hypothetical protein
MSGGRACGSCVACCDGSLRIKVLEHEVYPGKPCPFCMAAIRATRAGNSSAQAD